MKIKIDQNKPIHEQVALCLNRREANGMRCSRPRGHENIGHFWNIDVRPSLPPRTKLRVDEEKVRQSVAVAGEAVDRFTKTLTTMELSHSTHHIHLLVSDVGTLACGAPLGVGNGNYLMVTTDPETATCRKCDYSWLEYQRDQYREMFERNERVLADRLSELREVKEENIRLQHRYDELNRNAQGGH